MSGDAVLVGAGDIAGYLGPSGAEATATLLDGIPGTVFTTGDNIGNGVAVGETFLSAYEPTWGRHKARTRPSPGNHDYELAGGNAYFAYFGSSAGPAGLGYYSYDVGAWHVISLNSCVSMATGSAQVMWLRGDLESNHATCTAAYWHHPLFSSGPNEEYTAARDVWRLLYEFGVDLVMNGHNHQYERFAPLDPDGLSDPQRGIREFVVGTGGGPLYGFPALRRYSEARASVHGVLKLTLRTGAYEWEFIPVATDTFRDGGSGACH